MNQRIAGFELLKRLAEGGMGQIWLGKHLATAQEVAIKLHRTDRVGNEAMLASFRTEIAVMASLNHPNIVAVLDAGVLEDEVAGLPAGSPWLAMEFAAGDTLDSADLDWSRLREALYDVLAGLAHAHARRVLHRDIKPENVLCNAEGVWKLTDFGLAHARGTTPAIEGASFGFVAPEHYDDHASQGPWTDLYSVGALVWRVVTGTDVFSGAPAVVMEAHRTSPLPAFRPRFAVPPGLLGWLELLLRKHPDERYSTAADASAALATLGPATHTGELVPAQPAAQNTTTNWGVEHTVSPVRVAPQRSKPPAAPMPSGWRSAVDSERQALLHGAGLSLFALRYRMMVGRTGVRDQLWTALKNTQGGVQVAMVRGAVGLGARRLAEWMCTRAEELGAAKSLTLRRGSPLGEIAWQLSEHGSLRDVERLRQTLELSSIDADDIDAVMALALAQPNADEASALAGILRAATTERAAVIAIEDATDRPKLLHWIATAPPAIRRLPILFLLLSPEPALREESRAESWVHLLAAGADEIRLDPLSPSDMNELIASLLPMDPLLRARVYESADGSPMVAVQLVSEWVALDALELTTTGYRLRSGGSYALHSIHDGEDPVDALMQQLDEPALLALERLAALGPRALREDWFGSGPVPQNLVNHLSRSALVQLGPVLHWRDPLARTAILESARSKDRLRSHHAAIATFLQDDPDSARLGLHLFESGALADSMAPLVDGAWRLSQQGDEAGALALLDRASEAASAITAPPSALVSRAWRLRGVVLENLGDIELAQDALTQALATAVDPEASEEWLRAALAMAEMHRRMGNLKASLSLMMQAEPLLDDHPHQAPRLWYQLGMLYRDKGRLDHALEALRSADEKLSRVSMLAADIWHHMAVVLAELEELKQARAITRKSAHAYDEMGARGGVALSEDLMGCILTLDGSPKKALTHHKRALELNPAASNTGILLMNYAVSLCMAKKPRDAARVLHDAKRRLRSRQQGNLLLICALLQLWPLAATGQWREFDGVLTESEAALSLRITQSDAIRSLEACLECLHGSVHAARHDRVLDLLEHLEDVLRRPDKA